jgi:DnaJ-class molecular chaperone
MEQDHYKTLGLNSSATKEEIKSAFRKSALEFHPDRHAQSSAAFRDSAAAQFKKASEAYEILIDAKRRADYDFRWRNCSSNRSSSSGSGNYDYSYSWSYTYGGGGRGGGKSGSYYKAGTSGRLNRFDWRFLSRVMTTHGFIIGAGCVR